jgi:hypothetical protein
MMGSVLVSAAGRSDQEGVSHVEQFPEPLQNQNAAQSPDQYVYEAYPDRCKVIKSDGVRCRGTMIRKTGLCMVHIGRANDEEK